MVGQILAGFVAFALIIGLGAAIIKDKNRSWFEAIGESLTVLFAMAVYIGGLLGIAMLIGYAFTGEFYNEG